MSNITRFDPFKDLSGFSMPSTSLGDFFKGLTLQSAFRDMAAVPEIKLDVTEDDNSYLVKAEVPGVKKEDIEVSLDGNQVAISAELKQEKDEKEGKKLIRSERYCGKQYRSFSLDSDIDQSKATAEYKDGVLTLSLPKKGNSQAKKLTVN